MNRKQQLSYLKTRGWKCSSQYVHMADTNGRDVFNVLKIYRWTHVDVSFPLTREEAVAAEQKYERRMRAAQAHFDRIFNNG